MLEAPAAAPPAEDSPAEDSPAEDYRRPPRELVRRAPDHAATLRG